MWEGLFTQRTKPVNYCLIASNAAILVGCVVGGFVGTIGHFREIRDNLHTLHHTLHLDVSPCSLPVPSTALLSLVVGHEESTVWSVVPDESEMAYEFRLGLCDLDDVYQFLSYVTSNSSIENEELFLDAICDYDTEQRTFGDIRKRIVKAYMHANAAFVRAATGCPNSPFDASTCSSAAFVLQQITEAASDRAAGGFGHAPDTGVALYRLIALSVMGYYDRSVNSNACFGNVESANASYFCWNTYAERPHDFNDASSTNQVFAEGKPGYEAISLTQQTCSTRASTIENPPSPPPTPHWQYTADQWTHTSEELVSCSHALEYGLLDQRRLFGVPDPSGTFQHETSEFSWFSNLLYDREGLSQIDDGLILPGVKLSRRSRLLMYACYRLVAVTVYCMITNAALGFFFGFAAISSAMYVLSRMLGLIPAKVQIRPPPGPAFFFAVVIGTFAWFWGTFVDGGWHPSPYYVSPHCSSSSAQVSSPFMTTDGDSRGSRSWGAWLTLAVTLYATTYMLVFRAWGRMKKELYTNYRRLEARTPVTTLSMFTTAAMCVLLMMMATESKKRWFTKAIKPGVHTTALPTEELNDLENDLWVAVITPLFLGYAVGAMTQRWSIESGSNAFARLPWFATIAFSIAFPWTLVTWTFSDALVRQEDAQTRNHYYIVFSGLTAATGALLLMYTLALTKVPVAESQSGSDMPTIEGTGDGPGNPWAGSKETDVPLLALPTSGQ